MATTGKSVDFSFDPGPLTLADVQRLTADMWSDLAFDESTLLRLRRDGLALDGLRLTGPSPFLLTQSEDGAILLSVAPVVVDPEHAGTLLDLWRLHFMKGLRLGSLAA